MTAHVRCPYCFGDLDESEPVVICDRCRTPHHRACWEEHGRCVVLACGSRRAERSRADSRRHLAVTLGPRRHAFLPRGGQRFGAPLWLEVEMLGTEPGYLGAPRIELELARDSVFRGERVEATVTLKLARALAARGVRLGVRAERFSEESVTPETLIDHEAVLVGHPWEGWLMALKLVVATLMNDESRLVQLPAGTTRIRGRFAIDARHPVRTRGDAAAGRSVRTDVYAYVDIPAAPDLIARVPLEVRSNVE